MTYNFSDHANRILNLAISEASKLGHSFVGSEHLLLGMLQLDEAEVCRMLNDAGVSYDAALEMVKKVDGEGAQNTTLSNNDITPRTADIIEVASEIAMQTQQNTIRAEFLLYSMLKNSSCLGVKIMRQLQVDVQKLAEDLVYAIQNMLVENSTMYHESAGTQTETQGKSESGKKKVPDSLSKFGRDLTQAAREGKLDPIIGRENETERVIQILSRRTKNNPCLIGEPGVGKTAIAEGLAEKIVSGDVPDTLRDKTVFTLDISSMVAGSKYRGEFEERIKNVLQTVIQSKNIILFIDEIHMIVGAGDAEGGTSAANILKPALARGEIQLIGATTINEYRKNIEKDAALERRFQPVMVGEPSVENAIEILKGIRPKFEEHHHLRISDEAIEAAVRLSVRYINDRFLPDKAIDLVDEAASRIRIHHHSITPDLKEMKEKLEGIQAEKNQAVEEQNFELAASLRDKEKEAQAKYDEAKAKFDEQNANANLTVGENDIAAVVQQWTGIPVSKLEESEGERLLHLEDALKARVIGQDDAISAISKAIRRGRMGMKDPRRPIGSFIFLGKTGVGKTELCKALADILFGDKNAMIRLDMSEYMEKYSVSKLIGSPPGYVGYDEGGQLTEQIRRHPYSVVLFDEIEKAHPDVFNILLQVLDDGVLTDSQGRHVDFKNTIIIMTSNLGAAAVKQTGTVGFSSSSTRASDEKASHERMMNALKDSFRPEFLNRIDEIII
ncbi:MAG: ATP-dependent Clp protease ATP-binding subunit, partial [Clostridia bacterium]|nr:ATP-dependent Clp protease ATP-binding subunit [Clostridia bacterium]